MRSKSAVPVLCYDIRRSVNDGDAVVAVVAIIPCGDEKCIHSPERCDQAHPSTVMFFPERLKPSLQTWINPMSSYTPLNTHVLKGNPAVSCLVVFPGAASTK